MGINRMRNRQVGNGAGFSRKGRRKVSEQGGYLAASLVVLGLTPWVIAQAQVGQTIDLPAGPGPLDNPLKGYAAYSEEGESHHLPVSMAYADAAWSELEPKPGQFQFAEWERAKWDTPLAKGKHIVFRVWMDYPGQSKRQQTGVPKWLIDQGVKMTPYSDFGGGKSPDYEDPRLQSALLRLIAKLGERYDGNARVAFVQVGLLGHWGEFHTYPRSELFASEATQKTVVSALHAAFPHKQLMGRNPAYPSLQASWMGFHDDMIPEDTLPPEDWKFLSAMKSGGVESNWKVAPTGGEMVPGAAAKWLGPGWEDTLRAVSDAHFSWIGPYCPALANSSSDTFKQRGEELIRKLGYEFRLTRMAAPESVRRNSKLGLVIEGVNQGVAPFYYPWPVEVALLDGAGKAVMRAAVPVDIRSWLPGSFKFSANPVAKVTPGSYRLALGIVDPWKGEPSISFANRLDRSGGYTILTRVKVIP